MKMVFNILNWVGSIETDTYPALRAESGTFVDAFPTLTTETNHNLNLPLRRCLGNDRVQMRVLMLQNGAWKTAMKQSHHSSELVIRRLAEGDKF